MLGTTNSIMDSNEPRCTRESANSSSEREFHG